MEKTLPDPPFIRCHRSYIVHLGAVTGMTYTAVSLRGGVTLPLGTTYVRSLRAALRTWQGGEYKNDDLDPGL
jgi:DNA-binding LytR/AlgR family response regulator